MKEFMKIVGKWFNLVILLTILLILSFRFIEDNTPQYLPIGASVKIDDRTIDLEVARTFRELSKGLMFRPTLPNNRGMLFSFDPPQSVSFWMKNVLVSLDIVFIYRDKIVAIVHNAFPCQADPCAIYPRGDGLLVDRVIELNAGFFKAMVGDRINVIYY